MYAWLNVNYIMSAETALYATLGYRERRHLSDDEGLRAAIVGMDTVESRLQTHAYSKKNGLHLSRTQAVGTVNGTFSDAEDDVKGCKRWLTIYDGGKGWVAGILASARYSCPRR
jgi:hypothetical protein